MSLISSLPLHLFSMVKWFLAFKFFYYLLCLSINSLLPPETHTVNFKRDKQPQELRCCLNFMQSFFIVFLTCKMSTLSSCRWFLNVCFSKYEWKSIMYNEVLKMLLRMSSKTRFLLRLSYSYTIYQIHIACLYSLKCVWGGLFDLSIETRAISFSV